MSRPREGRTVEGPGMNGSGEAGGVEGGRGEGVKPLVTWLVLTSGRHIQFVPLANNDVSFLATYHLTNDNATFSNSTPSRPIGASQTGKIRCLASSLRSYENR